MPDNKPAEEVDVTKEWRATHGQKSAATRLRIFAAIAWVVAIGGEIAGIVMLRQHKFDHGNLAAADRPAGRDRDLRDCRQPDVEGGQQARSGQQGRHGQVLLPEPARRDHHA